MSLFPKGTLTSLVLILAFLFSACSHVVAPRGPIEVEMDVVGPIETSKEISIINGLVESGPSQVGVCGDYKYLADFELWTDFVVDQLETDLKKRGVRVVNSWGTSTKKAIVGVLDLNAAGTAEDPAEVKQALMEELKQSPQAKLVDIHEARSLTDLKKHGYEEAERYRTNYGLDMILHISQVDWRYHFSLIDLHTRKVNQTAIESAELPIALRFKGISSKVLTSRHISRVMGKKNKDSGIKEAQVKREGDYAFKVSVQNIKIFRGTRTYHCFVNVRVETSDGTWSKMYEGYNASPVRRERTIDGAIYKVMVAIMRDRDFRNAISR